MRIIIDGRLWSESGLGRYISNLVTELTKIDSENQYFILFLKKDLDKINLSNQNFHKVLADFKWYGISEQIKLPKLLADLHPDLIHFPHFNVPVFYKGKFVVTIHDLIHQHFQTRQTTTLHPLLHAIKKIGYKRVFTNAVKNSYKIIVPSQFVKNQLLNEWKIDADKIFVTYEGVDENILKLSKIKDTKTFINICNKFNLRKPYLFYVGNAQPHKNLSRLINVFGKIKDKNPDLSLVLSGSEHYFWEKIKKELQLKDVVYTGFVTDEEMVALYKNANAFVMPSLEEGFGIPILEAMACYCPVVSSYAASLPEVGGDAALYFDPKRKNDIAQKINQVLNDEKLRRGLIKNGEKRYKEFSWQKMAKQTLAVYQQS